jgi:demethylmenaquinone methyltransferase/2-methoxy-6-polyprenyl-1,4-benzoquinol methylase
MTESNVGDELIDKLINEQLEYYRARAAEYDDWWERRGRYDRGPDANATWFVERASVEAAFDALALQGEVLELAPGTGIWTERLARTAKRITAVDGSPEMIMLNRARLGPSSSAVRYVVADLFSWKPDRAYDGVVFCFWLSHVPRERLDRFAATVASGLRPGGRVFLLEGKRVPTSTAVDHMLPPGGEEVMTRRLNDGAT